MKVSVKVPVPATVEVQGDMRYVVTFPTISGTPRLYAMFNCLQPAKDYRNNRVDCTITDLDTGQIVY